MDHTAPLESIVTLLLEIIINVNAHGLRCI